MGAALTRMTTYRRPVPFAWWLRNRGYALFVVRELTSVFVGGYALVLLLLLRSLADGPDSYAAFLATLRAPAALIFHAVALAAAVYHSITWFRLAPMAVALRVGGRRVPGGLIVAANYAAWGALSVALAWLVLRG